MRRIDEFMGRGAQMIDIEKKIALEGDRAEKAELTSDPNSPLPSGTKITRGHPRTKNLQVRFADSEFDLLTEYAYRQGLPVSTVVRLLVLREISPDVNPQLGLRAQSS